MSKLFKQPIRNIGRKSDNCVLRWKDSQGSRGEKSCAMQTFHLDLFIPLCKWKWHHTHYLSSSRIEFSQNAKVFFMTFAKISIIKLKLPHSKWFGSCYKSNNARAQHHIILTPISGKNELLVSKLSWQHQLFQCSRMWTPTRMVFTQYTNVRSLPGNLPCCTALTVLGNNILAHILGHRFYMGSAGGLFCDSYQPNRPSIELR